MNILFFLIPKDSVEYIYNDFSIRQVLEKMDVHRYSAIPILDHEGHFVDVISEGDILLYLKNNQDLNLKKAEDVSITNVEIKRKINSITINSNIEDLLEMSLDNK